MFLLFLELSEIQGRKTSRSQKRASAAPVHHFPRNKTFVILASTLVAGHSILNENKKTEERTCSLPATKIA
jgi:hypothetical protein